MSLNFIEFLDDNSHMKDVSDRFNRFAWQFDAQCGEMSRDHDREFYLGLARDSGTAVLEVACGVGRVLGPILNDGISVYGVDISTPMLEYARNRLARNLRGAAGVKAGYTIARQNQAFFKMPRKFPLVMMCWNSYLNLADSELRGKCLARVYDHLTPGGRLVLDVDLGKTFTEEEPWGPWVEREDGVRVRARRSPASAPADGKIMLKYVYEIAAACGIRQETSEVEIACLEAHQVVDEVKAAGFDVRSTTGDFQGTDFYDTPSRRLVLIAKKNSFS